MSVHDMFQRLRPPPSAPEPVPPGRGGRTRILVAAALAVAAIAAWRFHVHENSAATPPVLVTAARGDVEEVVTAIGSLQPFSTVDVGAQVTGQLKKLYVHVGDDVQKGAQVAEIDSAVPSAKVDADNAQLEN